MKRLFVAGAAALTLFALGLWAWEKRFDPRSTTASPASDVRPLTIAAAADLRLVLGALIPMFENGHPGARVSASFGSSGTFYAQLINGAPFDVFLSADIDYPRQLVAKGLADADSIFTYGIGRIVVWTPDRSPLSIETLGLQALTLPAVRRVAIANPAHAPYGRAAEAALRSAGVFDVVKAKLVFGENIAQTLQFVQSGSADVGVVALSLVRASTVAGRYLLIPSDRHPPIEQGGAILRAAARPDLARAFRTFLLSRSARAVLEDFGFSLPQTRESASPGAVRPNAAPKPGATAPHDFPKSG